MGQHIGHRHARRHGTLGQHIGHRRRTLGQHIGYRHARWHGTLGQHLRHWWQGQRATATRATATRGTAIMPAVGSAVWVAAADVAVADVAVADVVAADTVAGGVGSRSSYGGLGTRPIRGRKTMPTTRKGPQQTAFFANLNNPATVLCSQARLKLTHKQVNALETMLKAGKQHALIVSTQPQRRELFEIAGILPRSETPESGNAGTGTAGTGTAGTGKTQRVGTQRPETQRQTLKLKVPLFIPRFTSSRKPGEKNRLRIHTRKRLCFFPRDLNRGTRPTPGCGWAAAACGRPWPRSGGCARG